MSADQRAPERLDLVVVGLGYVGLPLARAACAIGLRVAGVDVDPGRVSVLRELRSPIGDLTDADVADMAAAGFVATTSFDVVASADTVVICVPTPMSDDRRPDLGPVNRATEAIAARLGAGTLVVLESTTYPGTTEEVLAPILERNGLRVGRDVHLAFAPERINPGSSASLREIPRVVGGMTPACTAAAESFYAKLVDCVIVARTPREAEMSKLIENVYRHVNIALVNELAMVSRALKVDLWDAISCAASKPFGFQPFYPGAGVGGHCIPVDPHYLTYKVRTTGGTLRMAELADDINRAMPSYVAQRAAELLNSTARAVHGSAVLLLGVSYKPDVGDVRETPAVPVARRLRELGAVISFHDPFVDDFVVDGVPVPAVPDVDEAVRTHDLTVLLQRHSSYEEQLFARCRLLFDSSGTARAHSPGVL